MMAGNFGITVSKFVAAAKSKATRVQRQAEREVLKSCKTGSAITGSRGQRVDTAFLQKSWKLKRKGASRTMIFSDCAYAPVVEYNDKAFYDAEGNTRPADLPHRDGGTQWVKSVVGQNHAVAATMAGWPDIVAHFNAKKIRAADLSEADEA